MSARGHQACSTPIDMQRLQGLLMQLHQQTDIQEPPIDILLLTCTHTPLLLIITQLLPLASTHMLLRLTDTRLLRREGLRQRSQFPEAASPFRTACCWYWQRQQHTVPELCAQDDSTAVNTSNLLEAQAGDAPYATHGVHGTLNELPPGACAMTVTC